VTVWVYICWFIYVGLYMFIYVYICFSVGLYMFIYVGLPYCLLDCFVLTLRLLAYVNTYTSSATGLVNNLYT
jgi:hypothetical protein